MAMAMVVVTALIFLRGVCRMLEGWDMYTNGNITSANNAQMLSKWDSAAFTQASATPRYASSSGGYWNDSTRSNFIRANFRTTAGVVTTESAGIFGFGFNPGAPATTYNMNVVVLFDDAATFATVQLGVKLNNDLTLSIFRTSHSTILATSTATLTAGQWSQIEFKWKIADSISAGDVELRVNGVAVITLAGGTDTQGTANASATGFGLSGNVPTITSGGASTYAYDDFFWFDLTGSTNNGFVGEVRIITLRPDGNGNYSQMTGSDGNSVNNYQLVDDVGTPNADTDYVESSVATTVDTYTHSDLPASVNTVYAVEVDHVVKKTDTATRKINTTFRISSTDYDGAARQDLTSAYTTQFTLYDTSPATTTAWTATELNGAECGFKVNT